MKKIENIVFDLGGVLITNDDVGILVDNKETLGFLKTTQERVAAGWNAAWPLAKIGKIGETEFFEILLKEATGSFEAEAVERMKSFYREKTYKLPTFSLLRELEKKYRLFALTNIAKGWLDYKIERFLLGEYFDLIVASCNEGVAKPDKEIFERLISKTNLIPEKTLFVDDLEKNIISADERGFKTHLFTEKERLVRFMKQWTKT